MHIFANIALILSCAYLTTHFVHRSQQLIHNIKINPEQFRKKSNVLILTCYWTLKKVMIDNYLNLVR